MRLAQLIARRIPDVDPARAREIVRAGGAYVGRHRVRLPEVRVQTGDRVTVHPEASEIPPIDPATLRIVHRDRHLVVIDKPPGVPTVATRQAARGTLAEALRRLLAAEGVPRPYVGEVHRLDREASGLVMFAVRSAVQRSLHRLFVDHDVERTYRALLVGTAPERWTADRPLTATRGGRIRVDPGGRKAITHFRRIALRGAEPDAQSLVEARLETGRTHQIRVHAASSGHPIVGDPRYGGPATPDERLYLHAWRLEFVHPIDGTPVVVESSLPDWARTDAEG